jgi:hypothetical protein
MGGVYESETGVEREKQKKREIHILFFENARKKVKCMKKRLFFPLFHAPLVTRKKLHEKKLLCF